MQHFLEAKKGLENQNFKNGGVLQVTIGLNPRPVIFVVEDEQINRELLEKTFLKAGCRVFSAINGLEAIEAIENGLRPDLTITDMGMPVMGGEEFLLELQLLAPLTEILTVTGEAVPPSLTDKPFFTKPAPISEILAFASRALGTHLKIA